MRELKFTFELETTDSGRVRLGLAIEPGAGSPHGEMGSIFISYRRSDSADTAGRIYDRLAEAFGRAKVFKDVDSIPLGVPFRDHFLEVLKGAKFALIIVGPSWVTVEDAKGMRRLEDPGDYVRFEVETALALGIRVIPVFVGGTKGLDRTTLPTSIANLAEKNGLEVRPDPDFHNDVDRLVRSIEPRWRREPKSRLPGFLGIAALFAAPPILLGLMFLSRGCT